MSLGRGLESLIPPSENGEGGMRQEDARVKESEVAPPAAEEERGEEKFRAPEPKEETSDRVFQIEIERIEKNPLQPRRDFNEESLKELAASIREFGVLQPLVVSKIEEETEWGWSVRYELIAGERRLLAAKMAGLHTIPAVIREPSMPREKLEIAVIENIQRADLNPVEFARAVARLQDEFGLTQREIAVRLGKSREVVANAVRLLSLPSEVQQAVAEGKVSSSQARLLLSVEDPALREQLFREILEENPTVRELEVRVRRARNTEREPGAPETFDPEITAIRERLEEFLGTKVALVHKGQSGRITIAYYSPEEFDAIVEKLLKKGGAFSD